MHPYSGQSLDELGHWVSPAPSHNLKQCWFIVKGTLNDKLQWKLNRNVIITMDENAFEIVVYNVSAAWFWSECVNVVCELLQSRDGTSLINPMNIRSPTIHLFYIRQPTNNLVDKLIHSETTFMSRFVWLILQLPFLYCQVIWQPPLDYYPGTLWYFLSHHI